jgi:guanylate kinase
MIAAGEFLEWALVHRQHYGTPKNDFLQKIDQGVDIILEIDVQGAKQIRQQFPQAVNIFILPSSPAELKNRLEKRGKDTSEVIAHRLETAKTEIQHLDQYDYLIFNQQLETAAHELKSIVVAERCRLEYRQSLVDSWNKAANNWV